MEVILNQRVRNTLSTSEDINIHFIFIMVSMCLKRLIGDPLFCTCDKTRLSYVPSGLAGIAGTGNGGREWGMGKGMGNGEYFGE